MKLSELVLTKKTLGVLSRFDIHTLEELTGLWRPSEKGRERVKPSEVIELCAKNAGGGFGLEAYKDLVNGLCLALVEKEDLFEAGRFTRLFGLTDPKTLDDRLVCLMATIEDGLLSAGFKPGRDYSRADLIDAAMPLVRHDYIKGSVLFTTGWPSA